MADRFRVGITRDFLDEGGTLRFKDIGLGLLEAHPEVEYEFFPQFRPTVTPDQIREYDAVIVLKPRFTRESFEGVERLTAIARCGVGYDAIDVEACTDADVVLFITPDGVRYPMAEGVVTWMLMLSKRAMAKDRLVRSGQWYERTEYMGFCLQGRTLGLIGFGNIAREVVRLIQPFGMQVLAHDPFVPESEFRALCVEPVPLDALLRCSDFVSLHCPLNEATRGLIGERELRLMKPTAYLINTARGPIVRERALVQALQEGWIQGAAIDVFEEEPIHPDNPLLDLDNVILAPHAIGWTDELFLGNGTQDCLGILRVLHGEVPDHVVNREVVQRPGFQAKLAAYRQRFGSRDEAS